MSGHRDSSAFIVARLLQGVGGALLTPGSLAMIESSFRPADRARAIGAWSGLGGVATALGPLLGGYLVQAVSWRAIFLINLPLGDLTARQARALSDIVQRYTAGALRTTVDQNFLIPCFQSLQDLGMHDDAHRKFPVAISTALAQDLRNAPLDFDAQDQKRARDV